MHFQLFFPDKNSNATSCLRSVGLADFCGGASEVPCNGPGGAGLLVSWGSGKIGYEPANQRWVDSGEGYHVGFWADSPCVPMDIARASLFVGYEVPLADGNSWRVPAAAQLPQDYKLFDGHWNSVRKPQFNEYWERSSEWFRRLHLYQLDETTITVRDKIDLKKLVDDWCSFAVFALRQNYRLTPFIASELALLDSDSRVAVVVACCEGMAIREVLDEAESIAESESALKKEPAASPPDS